MLKTAKKMKTNRRILLILATAQQELEDTIKIASPRGIITITMVYPQITTII